MPDLQPTSDKTADARRSAPSPRVIDFDVYCQNCRYNLRGLAGDPVRCPECGQMNSLGEGEIPEALVAARLRRMEAPLAIGVGALLFAIPWQVLLGVMYAEALRNNDLRYFDEVVQCLGVPAFAPLPVWLGCVSWFRASCDRAPGGGRLLIRYHLLGLAAGGAMVAAALAIPVLWSPIGRGMRLPNFLAPALIFGAAIVGVRWLLAGPHRRLMARIHDLQRPTAILRLRDEARDRQRRPMYDARRGSPGG